jgi:hypothetical protein
MIDSRIFIKLFFSLLATVSLLHVDQKKNSVTGNKPPVIARFESSSPSLSFCPGGNSNIFCDKSNRTTVTLSVAAADPEGDDLTYNYSVSVGEILGQGTIVTWKLAGQPYGSHVATVRVSDARGAESTATLKVSIQGCSVCGIYGPPCPIISVSSYSKEAYRGEESIFHVEVSPGYFNERPDYVWNVEGGTIVKGQHTPVITVETTGDIGRKLSAIVTVSGLDKACSTSASGSLPIMP